MRWLAETHDLTFADYDELWRWSTTDLETFWGSLWQFFDVVASRPYTRVLAERRMPGARWFQDAELNYVDNVFRGRPPHEAAILFQREGLPLQRLTWQELEQQTAGLAQTLRDLGVTRGDRVVAYMPNIPQTIVAFLACAAIGAVWSACSPDFGMRSVIERFKQIEPKVLIATDGYTYGGKPFDRLSDIAELQDRLPSLEQTIVVPYLNDIDDTRNKNDTTDPVEAFVWWGDAICPRVPLTTTQVPFDHPLWVLYSSGTTGPPKALVQGHGGIILEHLKMITLHHDLAPGDRLFWFTTTGWMMWNFIVGGLLAGVTPVLYDGSPAYPDMNALWDLAEEAKATCFGTSAAYITACMDAGLRPGRNRDLSALNQIGSTGSPLSAAGFAWIYEHVKQDVLLASISGGTDLCTAFVGGCPVLPVHAGEIQCRCLGAKVEAYDEDGRAVFDAMGELVITEPMPSMPLYFWNDPDGERYRDSYFEDFPGVWRHGDWIKVTSERGSCIIYGRSDATINRGGVRMGTSDIYQVVESIPEIEDSLVIDLEGLHGRPYMPLFVVLRTGHSLDESLRGRIRKRLREDVSPRHVPDDIIAIREVPRTLNGKKLEVPVRKILMGVAPGDAVNPDSMGNPDSLEQFYRLRLS